MIGVNYITFEKLEEELYILDGGILDFNDYLEQLKLSNKSFKKINKNSGFLQVIFYKRKQIEMF